jgi:mRNA interferase HigB
MRRFPVRVISRKKIREAIEHHAEWEASLNAWHKVARAADWHHFPDVRQTWKSSDLIGTCVVFNISHNRCRLIAFINFRSHKVFILHILSHVEYEKGGWKNDCDRA